MGASSCNGNEKSIAGIVVEWSEYHVTLSDRYKMIDESLKEICQTLLTNNMTKQEIEQPSDRNRMLSQETETTKNMKSVHEKD